MTFSPILASLVSAMLGWALLLLSVFLILLILVQRGRGGGLTGALGGPGGQSAFGTKAGDLFTRITSFVALGWIALCAFTMWLIGSHAPSTAVDPTPTVSASPADQPPATSDMIDFGDMGGDAATDDDGDSPEAIELAPAVPTDSETDGQRPAADGQQTPEPDATDASGALSQPPPEGDPATPEP